MIKTENDSGIHDGQKKDEKDEKYIEDVHFSFHRVNWKIFIFYEWRSIEMILK